jgi:hypothetical protein
VSTETVVHHGDALHILTTFPDAVFDAVVTDPPYGLEFMGKAWDRHGDGYEQWCRQWSAECLRVLKPGGHLLAFGGTRTSHRLASGIEDAGFEIRDSITWIYGSGFPKSLDVSKAIDKAAGADLTWREEPRQGGGDSSPHVQQLSGRKPGVKMVADPATPDAEKWQGWGTALKPAHEPIIVARKPLAGTVAANVLAHGTGAINVDGCRVGTGGVAPYADRPRGPRSDLIAQLDGHGTTSSGNAAGRWPSNVILTHTPGCVQAGERRVRSSQPATFHAAAAENNGNTSAAYGKESRREGHVTPGYGDADGTETVPAFDCAPGCSVAELDQQSGRTNSKAGGRTTNALGVMNDDAWVARDLPRTGHTDTGGASRFFPVFRYQAKAPTRERPKVDGAPAHPTVKPLALMRWLVRLVAPPGGIILDPFAGSGTTLEAAIAEGFHVIGVEREAEYLPLIQARIDRATKGAAA